MINPIFKISLLTTLRSIAHPDATLEQYRLQDIRTKLVKFYGWNLDAIRKILEGYAAEPGDRRRRVNDFEFD